MKKSDIAKLLNNTVNIYSDFIQTGFLSEVTEDNNFEYFDKEPEKESKKISEMATSIEERIYQDQSQSQNNDSTHISDDVVRKRTMIKLASEIIKCNRCGLISSNQKPVGGFGNPSAKIFVISDFPSLNDEKNGFPLSDEVGDFFKKWISGIGIDFNELFVTTLIKCSLEGKSINSQKFIDTINNCENYLVRQIEIVRPIIIFALGETVLSALFKKNLPMKENHGKIFSYNYTPLIATYNPKEVLKDSELKKTVWGDLKVLKSFYDGKLKNG